MPPSFKKTLFYLTGGLCTAAGCVGLALPVIPQIPFFLGALVCFSKASDPFRRWLERTSLYQRDLKPYREKWCQFHTHRQRAKRLRGLGKGKK